MRNMLAILGVVVTLGASGSALADCPYDCPEINENDQNQHYCYQVQNPDGTWTEICV